MQGFRAFRGLRGPNAFWSIITQEQIVRAPNRLYLVLRTRPIAIVGWKKPF